VVAEAAPALARVTLAQISRNRRSRIAALAATSFVGGLVEAAFLVLITQAAFAITSEERTLSIASDRFRLTLVQVVVAGVALVIVRVGLALYSAYQTASLTSSVARDIRTQLATSFLAAKSSTQQGESSGRLQDLLTTFTEQGNQLVSNLATSITAGFNLLALLGAAVVLDPGSSAIVIATVAGLALVLKPIRKRIKRRAVHLSAASLKFASSLSEISQIGMELHVFRVQPGAERLVTRLISQKAASERRLTFARASLTPIYTGLAYGALLVALGAVSASGMTNIGQLGAVMLVMLRSLTYGQAIQSSSANVIASLPFLERLQSEIAKYEQAVVHQGTIPLPKGALRRLDFERVSFSYQPDREVLHELSFSIDHPEVIGIVGPSGSGKSTLVQLLLGLQEPTRGTITIDGTPTSEFLRNDWAQRTTFVPQAAHLLTGTISDNIRFFRDDVDEERVIRAAKLAHIHDEVMALPGGYDHLIGDGGGSLSGGQQQRLCIARALVGDPELLVLDEPTSALDVRSEHLIRATLNGLRGSTTIVVIAHRLSTLDICDRIMVIQDGHLRGFDEPARLAETNAFYREALELSGLR
jgi:ATP-binding cassette, subfamily B, bacterial